MTWEPHPRRGVVRWRIHLRSTPEIVYRFLATDEGRESFWADSAKENGGTIAWAFPNGSTAEAPILERNEPSRFVCEYFDGSVVEFDVESDGREGTELTVTNRNVPDDALEDVTAGWISVLMNLKAVVDNGIDLRNHDSDHVWDRGFVDN